MKHKIPNSPFATRLSKSAKGTQRRIHNLFQGTKKRPSWPVLTLTALAILLCGSLVSCQVEHTNNSPVENMDSSTTGSSRPISLEDPPIPLLTCDEVHAYVYPVPEGKSALPELPDWQYITGFVEPVIKFDFGSWAEPDEVSCTESLVVDRQISAPLARTVHLFQESGGEDWFTAERRADSSGEGMETRLYVLTCTWGDGEDALSLNYPFLLALPSVAADDPMDAPVIVVEDQRIELNGTCSANYQDKVTVNAPRREGGWFTASVAVDGGDAVTMIDRAPVGGDGTGSVSFPLPLTPQGVQTQQYTLAYEWDDGTQDTYHFTITANEAEHTPAPKASPDAPSSTLGQNTKNQNSAPATALESYRAVLLDEAQFLYVAGDSTEKSVNISGVPGIFSPSSQYAQIDQFVVLDLDGDGEKEVVLHIGDVANDMGGYLILHQADGKTYGFPSDYRTFWELKTDGTFQYSYNGSEDGIAFIRFTEMGYVMDKIIYAKGTVPYNPDTFIVNNQSVTQEEYDAAIEQQRKKPDAQWHEFTADQIGAMLP